MTDEDSEPFSSAFLPSPAPSRPTSLSIYARTPRLPYQAHLCAHSTATDVTEILPGGADDALRVETLNKKPEDIAELVDVTCIVGCAL